MKNTNIPKLLKIVALSILGVITFVFLLFYIPNLLQQNKKHYKIRVGESFEIYYSTNSCCIFVTNEDSLQTIKRTSTQVVFNLKDQPTLDEGSTTTEIGYTGIKPGIDTLKTGIVAMGDYFELQEDSTLTFDFESYIVVEVVE